MRAALSHRWRLALAALLAVAGATAVALLATDEDADGVRATTGRWVSLQPSPLSRSEVGAARVGSSIYVVGGFAAPEGATTDRVARYDIEAGTWRLGAPMPIAVNHPAVAATPTSGRSAARPTPFRATTQQPTPGPCSPAPG